MRSCVCPDREVNAKRIPRTKPVLLILAAILLPEVFISIDFFVKIKDRKATG
jgi:hypothetical protein